MFEHLQLLTEPLQQVTEAEVETLEQALDTPLPPDYRAFLMQWGPGVIDREIVLYGPADVIESTHDVRDLFHVSEEEGQTRFFTWYTNTTAFFVSADLDRLLSIGYSLESDYFLLLPDTPPRYFEFPRHSDSIRWVGTSMDDLLQYLNPRVRFRPQARQIVEQGILRNDDGRPNGTVYQPVFIPVGYHPPSRVFARPDGTVYQPIFVPVPYDQSAPDPTGVEEELPWGHEDDGLVNDSIGYHATGQDLTTIPFYMERYPVLQQLRDMALRDSTLRFETREGDEPHAELQVPAFDAHITVGPGMAGLALYIRVPIDNQVAFYRWLAAETERLGYTVPLALRARLPAASS
ncbi:MAG TPA: SMI1/KNR4 family protein [Chloroflexia bacterium]|nr:SMI1/KNR4 family protein [Chloroflexia bacterium]